MPIVEYVDGDLLESDHRYIAHGVNCQGVMGSGIAKQIKEKYPKVYEKYTMKEPKLGYVQWVECKNRTIINLFTQEYYGRDMRFVSYDAIDIAFARLNDQFSALYLNDCHILGIPKIGAGLGGGNWKIIETIINERTSDIPIVVYSI